ncbi:MAG: DUF2911 domain-containing protein [Planctomycetes bacterium]|nr:DUF2911 domain-containing protein [Planctomycetota bacterium]
MLATLFAFTCLVSMAPAQEKGIGLPPASPAATVARSVGNCKISVEYSSPGVKGRKIFGGMVPFGQVWRTGANKPTIIEFTDAVKFGDKDAPAGKYVLCAMPGKDSWTVILNKNTAQWGVYGYSDKDDVARVTVKPAAMDALEYLDIRLTPKSRTSVDLEICWEKTRVAVPITVDLDKDADKKIEEALAQSPNNTGLMFEAADYYLQSGRNYKKAEELFQKVSADKTFQLHSIAIWRLGQAQWKLGKKDESMKSFDAAAEAAKSLKGFEAVAKEIEAMKAAFMSESKAK